MEDEQIVELYWARAEAAIAETEKKYAGYCFHIADAILQCRQDAEECVNDTYLKAWNAMPPHRPRRLSTFLGKITRNLSLQRYIRLRAQKRGGGQVELALSELEECVPAGAGVEQTVEGRLLEEALDAFLRGLPQRARGAFVARYWYLCPMEEVAQRFGLGESALKSMLYRTRKKLKVYLEQEGFGG